MKFTLKKNDKAGSPFRWKPNQEHFEWSFIQIKFPYLFISILWRVLIHLLFCLVIVIFVIFLPIHQYLSIPQTRSLRLTFHKVIKETSSCQLLRRGFQTNYDLISSSNIFVSSSTIFETTNCIFFYTNSPAFFRYNFV